MTQSFFENCIRKKQPNGVGGLLERLKLTVELSVGERSIPTGHTYP